MTPSILALNVCGKNTLETKRNKINGKKRMNNKKRNPVAQELRTPKYKSRVVQDKRDKYKKDLSLKDVMKQAKRFLDE